MGSKYPLVLYTQIVLLAVDMIFNCLSVILYGNNTILLMLYILQDTLLVMSSIMLFTSFSSTFVFQIGLIPLLLITFLPSIIFTIFYILISIAYHYVSLNSSWDTDGDVIFDNPIILSMYIAHKFFACFYYSFYKRAAMHISEPKYGGDSEWLREKFKSFFNIKAPTSDEIHHSQQSNNQ
ncbi:unnamed protein product [Caenorhabditis bovis]|uniref:Transmembrane protein 138 n=1 Tax=Caenorhabditis bovis TaxID=2654633 RepID=A0A8S1EYA6_9PELO|nr:unnamed protein product [Caenorhabditis bovis]